MQSSVPATLKSTTKTQAAISKEDNEGHIRCEKCGMRFTSKRSLQSHAYTEHSY